MGDVKGIRNKVLKSDSMVFEFLRSIVSSQAASWIDMLISFGFFAWLGIYPWLATLCGAFAGGVTNCIINYKFTFHASGLPWKAVAVKYFLVWVGSVALNSLGCPSGGLPGGVFGLELHTPTQLRVPYFPL